MYLDGISRFYAYLMVLPVRRRIHCGIGLFCFCALASFCLVRKVLWLCVFTIMSAVYYVVAVIFHFDPSSSPSSCTSTLIPSPSHLLSHPHLFAISILPSIKGKRTGILTVVVGVELSFVVESYGTFWASSRGGNSTGFLLVVRARLGENLVLGKLLKFSLAGQQPHDDISHSWPTLPNSGSRSFDLEGQRVFLLYSA